MTLFGETKKIRVVNDGLNSKLTHFVFAKRLLLIRTIRTRLAESCYSTLQRQNRH